MSKSKSGTNIFAIIFKSLMIYLNNFFQLSRVMMFPVFGQLFGIFLIFYPTYIYREQYLLKLSGENLQQNLVFILLGSIIIVIPGFAVFLKAFWDYMIAMVSLNSMISDIEKKGSFGNFKAYNNSVNMRTGEYAILLLLLTLFWLVILIFPFLSFFLGFFINTVLISPIFLLMVLVSLIFSIILSVNFSLAFQIFAFESISPVEILKKSWQLMKGNFWRTVFMGTVLFIVTSFLVPGVITSIVDKSSLMNHLITSIESYVNLFAKNQVFTDFLASIKTTPFGLSVTLALSTIGTIITAMMLPLGSACFTLLYFDILGRK